MLLKMNKTEARKETRNHLRESRQTLPKPVLDPSTPTDPSRPRRRCYPCPVTTTVSAQTESVAPSLRLK